MINLDKQSELMALYNVVCERKTQFEEGSYTCYLFSKGEDKICKKCGEECAEMIIAAKNNDPAELKNEIADLLYHIVVLCAEKGLDFAEVENELAERSKKIGNLKTMKVTDRNT
jgi:phosphoribosyl-ATP pyrophosphohydrolase